MISFPSNTVSRLVWDERSLIGNAALEEKQMRRKPPRETGEAFFNNRMLKFEVERRPLNNISGFL